MLILKQKGQAITEYILVFTVSVFLTGGLLYQFNDAFKNFVNAYFGEYLTCLIESGELPTLGWEGDGKEDCSAEFQPFSLTSGRNPIANYQGQDVKISPFTPSFKPPFKNKMIPIDKYVNPNPYKGGNFDPDTRGSDGNSLAGGKDRGYGDSGGGGSGGFGNGGKWGGGLFGDQNGKGNKGPVALSKDEKAASESSIESTGGGVVGTFNRTRKSEDRPQYVPFSITEEEKSDGRTLRVPASKEDAIRGNSVAIGDVKAKKKAVDEDLDPGLDFSDFIKYLLIFGIIAAMVLFLGGQAMQISKSQEK